jgi:uncharacterized protein (TIGR02118 family)
MFKVVALLAKRADLSREQFIKYYESNHAPLVKSLFPWLRDYRRNFIDLAGSIIAPTAAPPDFDVITELWFQNRADYDRMMAAFNDSKVSDTVARDEENFLDRSKTRFFIVEEHGAA